MSTNHHTPIPTNAPANVEEVNDPLAALDQAITDIVAVEKDGHIIQDEGVDLTQQQRLNFEGDGVTVTNDAGNNATKVTIPGATVSGDMEAATYDPTSVEGDAFDMDNMVEGTTAKILTAVERSQLDYLNQYTFDVSISTDDLVVALKRYDGTDPTATDLLRMRVGTAILDITAALSVTVPASAGDIFAFDAGKIQGNDCQLFVYLVNNNGTPQIAVSPDPNLQTVSTNYYDGAGQTGSAVQSNIVMSGTRHATNSCDVIGRINARQTDADLWQSPDISKIVNYPIWETDWLYWSPDYTGFSTPPATKPVYKISRKSISHRTASTGTGTSNATGYTLTGPFITASSPSAGFYAPILVLDNGAWVANHGTIYNASGARVWTVVKTTLGVNNFTASGTKCAWGDFDAVVF